MTDYRRFAAFEVDAAEAGRASAFVDDLYPKLFETCGLDADRLKLSFELMRSIDEPWMSCRSRPHPDHGTTMFDVRHMIHRGFGTVEMMWHAEETAAGFAWLDRRRRALTILGVPSDALPNWALHSPVTTRRIADLGLAGAEERAWDLRPDRAPAIDVELGEGIVLRTSVRGAVALEIPNVGLAESMITGLVGAAASAVVGHAVLEDSRITVSGVTRRKTSTMIALKVPIEAPTMPVGCPREVTAVLFAPWDRRGYVISDAVGKRLAGNRKGR